jgi:hypothetical protein
MVVCKHSTERLISATTLRDDHARIGLLSSSHSPSASQLVVLLRLAI